MAAVGVGASRIDGVDQSSDTSWTKASPDFHGFCGRGFARVLADVV